MTMTKREEVFYKNLIIGDEDKIRAEKSLKSKGVEKHILIKERLLNWSTSESIEYEKVASTYRYDKRIRYTLFKYISYLEELYRAVILDNYVVDVRQKFWIKDLREQLKAYSNNLNDALEHIDFSALLIQCQRLPKEVKALCGFPKIKHLNDDSIALKELRNAVMHNKFLLLYRGYDICYVDGVDDGKSASLKANILNLIQFLPPEVGEQCAKDINVCNEDIVRQKINADKGNAEFEAVCKNLYLLNDYRNNIAHFGNIELDSIVFMLLNRNEEDETKWDLPSQIVITIDA